MRVNGADGRRARSSPRTCAETELALGVRPEHIRFDDAFAAPRPVFGAEYLGTTQIVTVETEHGQVKARLPADVPASAAARPSASRFRPERLSLFDAASGRAIRTALHEGRRHG